jgi:hypothetical protein
MGRWSVISATKRGVDEVVALNPQRNPETADLNMFDTRCRAVPPTFLCPSKDPSPRHL